MKPKKAEKSGKGGWAIGGGALALALAGAYFLYASKHAEANRKKVKGWMNLFEKEFFEGVSKLKEINEEAYHNVIDGIAKRYEKAKGIDSQDLKKFVKNMKGHLKTVKKHIKKDIVSKFSK